MFIRYYRRRNKSILNTKHKHNEKCTYGGSTNSYDFRFYWVFDYGVYLKTARYLERTGFVMHGDCFYAYLS